MQIVVGTHSTTDVAGKMMRIDRHEIKRRAASFCFCGCIVAFFCNVEYGGNVLAVESTLRSKELQSVTVERQMACSNHHSCRSHRRCAYGGHKHSRCGSQSTVNDICASLHCPFDEGFLNAFARQTAVCTYCHREVITSGSVTKPFYKRFCNYFSHFRCQIHVFSLNTFKCHAPYIGAIL